MAAMMLSPNEMAWCLVQAGFTGIDTVSGLPNVVVGVAVGLAESKGDTDALGKVTSGATISGNYDHGWLQISNKWHGPKLQQQPNWRDPLVNAQLARLVYEETLKIAVAQNKPATGWTAWSTFNGGSYKTWVPFAQLGAASPFPPARSVPEVNLIFDPTTIPLDVSVTTRPAARAD